MRRSLVSRSRRAPLVGQQALAGLALHAAVQLGDDRLAVLGDHQGLPLGQLADLLGPHDRDVVAGEAAAAAVEPAGGVGDAADADGAEQVGDLLVERDVLGAAEHHQDVGEAEQGSGLVLAEDARQLGPGLGGPDERQPQGALVGHPGAQGRQRRGGGQLVEHREQRRAQPAAPRGVVGQQQAGVEHVLGDRGHQRAGRGVGVLAAEQVDGAAAPDDVGQVGGRAARGWGCTGAGCRPGRTGTSPAGRW